MRVGEACLLGDERSKKGKHALGQAADGKDGGLPSAGKSRVVYDLVERFSQAALRHQHKDGISRNAPFDQRQHALHGSACFTASGFAMQADAP